MPHRLHWNAPAADPARLRAWALPIALSLLMVVLEIVDLAGPLRYLREAILTGQYWRIVTGHLVHLGWAHLLLNLAGLALVWLLFGPLLRTSTWLATAALSAVTASLGLLWLDPQLTWYAGFSGVLHGLFVAGTLAAWRRGDRGALLLLAALAAKLVWEQWQGAAPGSVALIGGAVVVDAHLYGAVGGLLGALRR
jgi:rhomboid family GlyGly-CTERM serine protease